MDNYSDILEYVFSSGQIKSGNSLGAVDPDEVEVCVRYEAEERGVDPNAAWEYAKSHIIISHAAAAMGRKGGSVTGETSKAKADAARENGKQPVRAGSKPRGWPKGNPRKSKPILTAHRRLDPNEPGRYLSGWEIIDNNMTVVKTVKTKRAAQAIVSSQNIDAAS